MHRIRHCQNLNQNEMRKLYEVPAIEWEEVAVELGFATTGGSVIDSVESDEWGEF